MTKNTHIEHPEDSILTGDLSVLDAFLMPLILSLKIDGAPAIVWGRNPATGCQFVGTKSVFNKKKIIICETPSDIETNYQYKSQRALGRDYATRTEYGEIRGRAGESYRGCENEQTKRRQFLDDVGCKVTIVRDNCDGQAERGVRDADQVG